MISFKHYQKLDFNAHSLWHTIPKRHVYVRTKVIIIIFDDIRCVAILTKLIQINCFNNRVYALISVA